MLYLALVCVFAVTYGSPLPGQLFYYQQQPHFQQQYQQQYVKAGLLPYVHYQVPSALKALQRIRNQNEIVYTPGLPIPNPHQELIRNQQGIITPAATARFTAPPQGLVDAIYTWFAENNVPIPEGPSKNEVLVAQTERYGSGEKLESEVDALAEAEKNTGDESGNNQPIQPVQPGQRFFILNGQPQYVGIQQVVPNMVMRSALPEDQNLVYYQPQSELQQNNLKLRNSGVGVQNQEVYSPQSGFYFLRNNPRQQQIRQEGEVRPINYHGIPEAVKNQHISQPLFVGGILPRGNEGKQQVRQPQLVYHQIFAPISVVPPQENQVYNLPQYQPQQAEVIPNQHQSLTYITIPVNNDVQLPHHYVKAVVPIRIDAQTNQGQDIHVETNKPQQITPFNQIQTRFALPETKHIDEEQKKPDTTADLAAYNFVRYLQNREDNEQYSDAVVIDAKIEQTGNKEEPESDVVPADEPSEPTIAQAQPAGIALAGVGGIATTSPKGTALAGAKGLAVSSPRATAVAGPNKEDAKPVKKSF